ncbi:MAG: prephenate dehydrogenase [Kiritimatiellae bacterium]|nr:prephenate dehydrogenase [Kiritimatiellia bacterium]
MKIAVIGRGLIGGSLMKAAARAGHDAVAFDKGERPEVADADVVFVAVPPSAVVPVVDSVAPSLRQGAVVVDVTGVKGPVLRDLMKYAFEKRWFFVGGHPMAGKERAGFANSTASLFDGASMILTPFPTYGRAPLDMLERLFRELGFSRVVYTDPAHHDEMIAYTSQLCHLISSAYVRDPLSGGHFGYSAGSFRDMVRVGAPDPDTWTELFFSNTEALLPVLDRFIGRMRDFRDALAAGDRARLHAALVEGVAAKHVIAGDNQEPKS